MSTYPAKQIHISINSPFEKVYEFVSNQANLPTWAAGLADATLRKDGEEWVTNSPMGEVRIKFVDKNSFGIVDHFVTIPNGNVIYTPLRVIKNKSGSEVVLTLFQTPEMSDEDYARDEALVRADLEKLKSLLED